MFNSAKFGHGLYVFLRHPDPIIDVDRCVMELLFVEHFRMQPMSSIKSTPPYKRLEQATQ